MGVLRISQNRAHWELVGSLGVCESWWILRTFLLNICQSPIKPQWKTKNFLKCLFGRNFRMYSIIDETMNFLINSQLKNVPCVIMFDAFQMARKWKIKISFRRKLVSSSTEGSIDAGMIWLVENTSRFYSRRNGMAEEEMQRELDMLMVLRDIIAWTNCRIGEEPLKKGWFLKDKDPVNVWFSNMSGPIILSRRAFTCDPGWDFSPASLTWTWEVISIVAGINSSRDRV